VAKALGLLVLFKKDSKRLQFVLFSLELRRVPTVVQAKISFQNQEKFATLQKILLFTFASFFHEEEKCIHDLPN
jgi:hypothetical protein